MSRTQEEWAKWLYNVERKLNVLPATELADEILSAITAARREGIEESKKVILDLAEAGEWLGTVAGLLPCDCPGEDDCLPECPFGDSAKVCVGKVYPHREFVRSLLLPGQPAENGTKGESKCGLSI